MIDQPFDLLPSTKISLVFPNLRAISAMNIHKDILFHYLFKTSSMIQTILANTSNYQLTRFLNVALNESVITDEITIPETNINIETPVNAYSYSSTLNKNFFVTPSSFNYMDVSLITSTILFAIFPREENYNAAVNSASSTESTLLHIPNYSINEINIQEWTVPNFIEYNELVAILQEKTFVLQDYLDTETEPPICSDATYDICSNCLVNSVCEKKIQA